MSDGKSFVFLLFVPGGWFGWVLAVGLVHFFNCSFGFGFWVYGVVVCMKKNGGSEDLFQFFYELLLFLSRFWFLAFVGFF